ncbi:hypothetical protein [Thiocystis violacea]|uniref:hypothetical protein n=1 Tax=Thiocystis violacea TaxID=13725 RepID=UPI001905E3E0|nr:hypothetical protein [Thiocystis violacea]
METPDLVNEMACVDACLKTLITPEEWAVFQTFTPEAMAAWLLATAQQVQLRKYRKHPRGPKHTPPTRTHDPKKPHVSVARLLAQRQQPKTPSLKRGERHPMIDHVS